MFSVYVLRGSGELVSEEDGKRKYRISIGAYGSIEIEAPTKKDALDLFKEVTRTKTTYKLDECIR